MASYSSIETFKNCPRQYAYKYVEKPPVPKQESIEAFLGKTCHTTIQQIYKDLRLSKLMSLEETLEFYAQTWDKTRPESFKIVRGRYSEDNYRETGRRFIKDFYESSHPFQDGRTLGIEYRVDINIKGEYMLVGYIDRLVEKGPGVYEIIDYKTSASLPALEDLERNWQLPLYQIGLSQAFPDMKECVCTWYFLAHNKPISLKKSALDLDELTGEVLARLQHIEAAQKFEPRVSALCSWCDYERICPARRHIVQVESLGEGELSRDDGVKLTDAYVCAQRKMQEAKAEIEEIEAKIFRFAREQNLSALRGRDSMIKIWRGEGIKFPKKDEDPEANKLVADILKRHGLWDSYSMIQNFTLSKAIQAGSFPAAALDELRPLMRKEEVAKLYVSKLRQT